jgi:Arc/MetJ family transcription regulator
MPITSVDVDADMLRQAKKAYGVRTNREAINLALQDTVMRQRQLAAIESIAAMELDDDAETIAYGR